ncbi:MAG: leucine-rich repeat protein, partial [Muribaculaceae bacterium]|nr:leucine-rich repeat protein [Muribaculaceae bacterium]
MIKKFYTSAGWTRKCMTLMIMALCAITAQAYTTISDVVIGNFKYNIYQATAAGEVTHAGCSGLSSAGASLTDVTIPGYVTYNGQRLRVQDVGYAAFMGNTNIKVVRLGYGIEGVSLSSFEGCTSLYRVYLPSSMKSVYKQSFYGCTNLTYVMFAGDTPPTLGDIAFYNTPSTKYVSCATYRGMNAMKADERWSSHFSNIGYHLGYYACDFSRTPNGTTHYYVIRNGIPYSNSGTNRSSCLLVGASAGTGTANIRLEQNVSTIDNNDPGSYHFYGVPDSAFMNMSHIGTIVDNSTFADKIGIRAFYNCTNLTSAQLRVDSIESYAFYNCTKLASVDFYNSQLGQGLRRLGGYAFGQTALTTVTIPKTTIQTMGYAPFYNCQSLKSITVDEANTAYCSYNDCLYDKSKTWLYQIPGAVVNNSNQADFIPTTLTRVLMFAGYGNTTLTNLNLSYGVTTIDDQAFSLMSKLSTVRLPSSLTSIGQYAFRTSPVTQIYCAADNPPSFTFGGFTDAQLKNITLTVPYGRWSAYKNNTYWGKLNLNTAQGSWCMAYDFLNQGTGYRVINSSEAAVVYIKDGNNGIYPTITVGNKTFDVTEIGNWASYNTRVGVSITNGYTIKRIKPRAFYNCELSNFTFSNVEEIGDSAFMNTTQMKVDLNSGTFALTHLKSIYPHAFDGSNLTAFKGYAPLTYIGHDAFARTSNMKTVDLSACTGLKYIYDYVFAQISANPNGGNVAAAHETVKLPNSVTSIGYYAFYNNVLSTFNLPANLQHLRKYAFKNSALAGEVELPYGITTLEEECLSSDYITRIVIPASITSVHSRFFNTFSYSNPKLNTVVINTTTPLTFVNDNEDINYSYQRATALEGTTIYVPVGKVTTWKGDDHWKSGFNIAEGSYDFTGVTGDKFTVITSVPSGTGTCRIVYNPETY